MADAPKTRGQMAIKSKRLDADWQLLVKKAAERAGMGIGDFIVEAARARAQAVLKSEPEDGIPAGNPPARLEDVAGALTGAVEKLGAELRREHDATAERQAEALDALRHEQAAALAKLERQARRGRWR
jgi:hypothetical protein